MESCVDYEISGVQYRIVSYTGTAQHAGCWVILLSDNTTRHGDRCRCWTNNVKFKPVNRYGTMVNVWHRDDWQGIQHSTTARNYFANLFMVIDTRISCVAMLRFSDCERKGCFFFVLSPK